MATADELLAKIYANPDDDGLRAVWADALIEQGDPRGEFVALQLSSTRNEARERSLVHKHWKNWVGPLAPFLMRGDLRFSVLGIDAVQLASLATRATPLPWNDLTFQLDERVGTTAETRAAIAATEAFPKVKSLGVDIRAWGREFTPLSELRWLIDSPLFDRAEVLRVCHVRLGEVIGALGGASRRSVQLHQGWESHFGRRLPFGRCERLTLGGGRCELEVSWPERSPGDGTFLVDDAVASLSTVPPEALTSLRVALPASLDPSALERATRRFTRLTACEIVQTPE